MRGGRERERETHSKTPCNKGYVIASRAGSYPGEHGPRGNSLRETFLLTSADNLEVDFADQIGRPRCAARVEFRSRTFLSAQSRSVPLAFLSSPSLLCLSFTSLSLFLSSPDPFSLALSLASRSKILFCPFTRTT